MLATIYSGSCTKATNKCIEEPRINNFSSKLYCWTRFKENVKRRLGLKVEISYQNEQFRFKMACEELLYAKLHRKIFMEAIQVLSTFLAPLQKRFNYSTRPHGFLKNNKDG